MVVEQHPGESMVLLTFLILLLTVVLLLMLVTLTMAIIMVYMALVSLKEYQRKAANQSAAAAVSRGSSGHTLCAHCSSIIAGTPVALTTQHTMAAAAPLKAQATTEVLQLPAEKLHNTFTLPSGVGNGSLNSNVGKNDDRNMVSTSTLHYIHSTLSERENEMLGLVQLEDTDHSTNKATLNGKSNINTSDEEVIVGNDNKSISSLHGTSNTVLKSSNVDVLEKQDVKPLTECDQVIVVGRTNSHDEEKVQPKLKLTNSFENIEMCQIQIKEDSALVGITKSTIKTITSSKQDSTNEDISLIDSESNSTDTINNTVINTEESDNLSKIKIRKQSDEDILRKIDIAIKNTDLCYQDNGLTESKENQLMQNSENVTDLNSHDANTENESHTNIDNQNFKKLDTQSFETFSLNSSQILSHNASSEIIVSTSVSSESLSTETSKTVATEETSFKISESTMVNISNNSSSANTTQNTILTDLSIKSSPETAVKQLQETNHKISSNSVLQSTPAEDSHTSNRVNPAVEDSIMDISNKDSSNTVPQSTPEEDSRTSNRVNPAVESSIMDISDKDSSNMVLQSTPAEDSHTSNRVNPAVESSIMDISDKDSSSTVLQSTPEEDSHTSNRVNPVVKSSVMDISNKDSSVNNSCNKSSVQNVSSTLTSPGKIENSSSTTESREDPLSSLFKEADEMYQKMDYDNLYVLLKHSKIDQKNDEFLWRLGRVTWQRAMKESKDTEQLSLHKEALGYVHSALALNETNSYVHRWISIITDYVARATDVRTRVAQSVVCRDHMFRAVELNPNDGTSWYLLGFWHYCAAELPWYQRRIARALFSTDFSATYEQALNYFLKGYKNNPDFYSTNVYMIGRCYQKMGRRDEAITWIRLARDYRPIRTWNDKETHEEATEKLKKLEARY